MRRTIHFDKKQGFILMLLLFSIVLTDGKVVNAKGVKVRQGKFNIESTNIFGYYTPRHFRLAPCSLDEELIRRVIAEIPEAAYGWVKDKEYIRNGIFSAWEDSLNLYEIIPLIRQCIKEEGGVQIGKRQGLAYLRVCIGVEGSSRKLILMTVPTDSHVAPQVRWVNLDFFKPAGGEINYCPDCGEKIPAEARFCPKCGRRIRP